MKSLIDTPEAQVVWIGPLKAGAKKFSVQKTAEGHVWLRIGSLLMTDCDCIDVVTGELRGQVQ